LTFGLKRSQYYNYLIKVSGFLVIQSKLMKKIIVSNLIIVFTVSSVCLAQQSNDDQLIESILKSLDKTTPEKLQESKTELFLPEDSVSWDPADKTTEKELKPVNKVKQKKVEQKEQERLKSQELRNRELTRKLEKVNREKIIKQEKKERLAEIKHRKKEKERAAKQRKRDRAQAIKVRKKEQQKKVKERKAAQKARQKQQAKRKRR